MGNCKDCRWWDGMFEKFPAHPGNCTMSMRPEGMMSGGSDMSGEAQEVMTMPDFGCVQFEARE